MLCLSHVIVTYVILHVHRRVEKVQGIKRRQWIKTCSGETKNAGCRPGSVQIWVDGCPGCPCQSYRNAGSNSCISRQELVILQFFKVSRNRSYSGNTLSHDTFLALIEIELSRIAFWYGLALQSETLPRFCTQRSTNITYMLKPQETSE